MGVCGLPQLFKIGFVFFFGCLFCLDNARAPIDQNSNKEHLLLSLTVSAHATDAQKKGRKCNFLM